MKVNKKNIFLETDDLGLVGYFCDFESDFYKCLREYLDSFDKKDDSEITKKVGIDRYDYNIRFGSFFNYIYNKSDERVLKEFFDDYGYKISNFDKDVIIDLVYQSLDSYLRTKLNKFFRIELRPYISFRDDLISRFDELLLNYDIIKDGINCRFAKLQKDFDSSDEVFSDRLDDDDEYNDLWNKKIDIENRVNSFRSDIFSFVKMFDSFLYLEDDDFNKIVHDYAWMRANKYCNMRMNSYKYNEYDYVLLIDCVKKFTYLMPGTVSIVISEIERVAREDGISLKNHYFASDVRVADDFADNDHFEFRNSKKYK